MKPFDRRGLLNAFFRRQKLFLWIFAPILIAGLLDISLATPVYESTAKLLVKFGPDARPQISTQGETQLDSADARRELVQSDAKILASRDLAEALLNDLSIGHVYPAVVRHKPDRGTPMDVAVRQFGKDLLVKTENDSDMISVSLGNHKPDVAADELRHLIDLFITRQSQIYSNPQTSVLHQQAEQAYDNLQDADRSLHEYMASAGLSSADEEVTLLLQQRGAIASYLVRRPQSGTASGMTQKIAYRQGEEDDMPSDIPAAMKTNSLQPSAAQIPIEGADRFPVLDGVQRKIGELQAKEADLLQTYRSDSEPVEAVRHDIALQLHTQKYAVAALGTQIADLDRQIAAKEQARVHYGELAREVQVKEQVYKTAQNRSDLAQADDDLNQRKITQIAVIEQPTLPYQPVWPRKSLILGLCLLMGLAFACAAVLIAEQVDSRFALPEEAATVLGVPVLADFPRFRAARLASSHFSLLESGSRFRRISS